MKNLAVIYDNQRWQKNQDFWPLITKAAMNHDIAIQRLMAEDLVNWQLEPNTKVWMRCINPEVVSWLTRQNFEVFNNPALIALANDKRQCSAWVKSLGIPVIPDWDGSFPCVVKTIDGHGGQQVHQIADQDTLNNYLQAGYLVQPLIKHLGDVRVYVVANQIVGAVLRQPQAGEFRSNFSLGGKVEEFSIDEQLMDYVKVITSQQQVHYGGIDFLVVDNGYLFNEIEDVVGARMLYATTKVDILELWMGYLKEHWDDE